VDCAARPAVAGDKVFALAGRRAEAARTEFGFERIRRRNLGTGPFVLQTLRETKRQQLLDEAAYYWKLWAKSSFRNKISHSKKLNDVENGNFLLCKMHNRKKESENLMRKTEII
jgi:hypothetical protein